MTYAFSKIWIIVILAVVLTGGFFTWQQRGQQKDEVKSSQPNQAVVCKIDSDCLDENACTDDRCAQGNCIHTNSVAGLSCGATIPGQAQTNFCDGAGKCVYYGPIQGPTADWKTYKNNKYWFEIQYPPTISLFKDTSTEAQFSKPNDIDFPDIVIKITETNLTPIEWINNYSCKPLPSGTTLCTTPKAGLIPDSIQFQSQGTHFNSVDTIFKHNGILFEISLNEKRAAPIPQDEFNVYNQMLSTFRFLE